jgi:hypothetical protein
MGRAVGSNKVVVNLFGKGILPRGECFLSFLLLQEKVAAAGSRPEAGSGIVQLFRSHRVNAVDALPSNLRQFTVVPSA